LSIARSDDEQNTEHCQIVGFLQKEVVDLREANRAQKQEINALSHAQAKSDREMSELRAQYTQLQAKSRDRREPEHVAFYKQESGSASVSEERNKGLE